MFNQSLSRRSFLTISAMTAASTALDWGKISAYAAKMGPKSDYPTVVIGAGLGGLICGAYLAKHGIPVTVVEQNSIPGGYATSFDRAGGKFTFEVSLHGTSINTNAPARILNEIGVLDKINLVQLPEVYRYKTPKLDISVPQRDPEEYIKRLSARFPDEAEGIRGFVEEMIAISEEENRLHFKKGRFFKLFFPFQYRKMWNVRNKTLAELMSDYVKNPELQDVLAALWGYYGLPPSKLSGFYYANATGGYLRNGSFYIRQRSQDLSDAIAQVIEENGGRILYNSPVDSIRVEKGVVKGVELSGGERLPARAVVSNASVPATFQKMVPEGAVPEDYLEKLRGYKPSISSFIVWLGLNRDIREITGAFSTHVSSGLSSEQDYQAKLDGDIENGSFGVAIYDNIFKGYSAPGTSTLQLIFISGYEPWRRFESNYREENKTAYHREKARWTDILIKRAEREVIPGLSSMIEVKEAATPLTNWRYTGNSDGAIYGFEQSMDNAYMNRIENHTPIKGLYLAGAWGDPGGGYTGAMRSGEKAFQALMEEWGG
jgi:phytoene dehydrogenase-like protein